MRKIDAFAHILPRAYLDRLERQLEQTMDPSQLAYYRAGVFAFDPVLTDLDARWRTMDEIERIAPSGAYAQVLVLAVPPLEEVGPPAVAAEFARIANDEMAELVRRFPDRFVGFAAALPMSDVEAAAAELDRGLSELGALGAQVYTNVLGAPLDDPRFEPLFTRLEEAGRAVWLHPTRSAAANPAKRSGNRRTSSAISSLAMRAKSAAMAGGPTSSSGGTASTRIWAYSPYGSILRQRASRSVSTGSKEKTPSR